MSHPGSIVVLLGTDLKKCTYETMHALYDVVNDGYYRNNIKFKILKSKRISSVDNFSGDLGFHSHPELSALFLYFEGDLMDDSAFDVKKYEGYKWYTPKKDVSTLPNFIKQNSIFGTVGYKPHHHYTDNKHFEVTAFTSFKPNVGTFLLPLTEKYFATLFEVKQYIVEIIVEHNLVSYYSKKHNYIETARTCVATEDDRVAIGLTRSFDAEPFTLSTMIKDWN
ncbi:hypothetical protein ACO0QE_000567 [Hanseniaspora vineae]